MTQGQLRRDEWTHRPHHDHPKGVPYVADEESARRLLPGKDIEWVGKHPDGKYPGYDGWYYRMLGGKKHMKIMLGRPNGAVVQNPT